MTTPLALRRLLAALLVLCVGLLGGLLVGKARGMPFVGRERGWSIGVYGGPSPFALEPHAGVSQPVLTAADVTDVPALFVADPFMAPHDGTWYMFLEVMNGASGQGDIGLATSDDALHWTYQRIVLDEPFHLSYPYVFAWEGTWYMIPESHEAERVRLYRAESFPDRWVAVADLIDGPYSDSSLLRHDGRWWLFVGQGCEMLRLFLADALTGPWTEHPASPVVIGDGDIARPGGRVLEVGGTLYRLAQDDVPTYGNKLRAIEITELTPTGYAERPIEENPILDRSGHGWNGLGMHHADPHQLPDGRWIACVDGNGDRRVFGWRY